MFLNENGWCIPSYFLLPLLLTYNSLRPQSPIAIELLKPCLPAAPPGITTRWMIANIRVKTACSLLLLTDTTTNKAIKQCWEDNHVGYDFPWPEKSTVLTDKAG